MKGTEWLVLFGAVCCGASAGTSASQLLLLRWPQDSDLPVRLRMPTGLFWSVEGAMVMGCGWTDPFPFPICVPDSPFAPSPDPEPRKRGRYLAYWLGFRNAGMILGGAINLGLNASNSKAGSISSSTYIVFIVLQAISPLVGFLVSSMF